MFGLKSNELLAALTAECEDLRRELQDERSRRIAAETIATERKVQLEAASEQALRFEKLYAEATTERLKSLDVVNGVLLRGMAPEQPQMYDASPQQSTSKVELSPKRMQSRTEQAKAKHIEAAIKKLLPSKATTPLVQ